MKRARTGTRASPAMRTHHRDRVVLGLSGIVVLLSGLVLLAVAGGAVVA